MITPAIRLKNIAFLVVAVLVLGYLGVRYAGLGHYVGLRSYYTVTVQLPQTGGLYTHSNVTYRGVSVGRVGPIELTGDGVEAELRIEKDTPPIPDSLQAVVANLSAVGEQYVDLRPTRSDGPYLGNGSVIDEADTTLPAPPTTVLTSVNDFASSVDLEHLRTVVEEFGTAFEGRGDDLQVLLDSGSEFIGAADRALPVTTRLMADGETVLHPGRTGCGAQGVRLRGQGTGRRTQGIRRGPPAADRDHAGRRRTDQRTVARPRPRLRRRRRQPAHHIGGRRHRPSRAWRSCW
ncbi:Mce/MlaD domain-containing protein OS=Streptomyces microflavus OX=1919 GN=Smic_71520 PE=4 SV=1 [Streptomyces microflavus]